VETIWFILLIIAAFWLGACPFAYWLGNLLLHKDIRNYGDHNPGAANVFKAGSIKWGFLAVFLDIIKGVPFVLIAISIGLPEFEIYFIGLCAILGHAFSPILKLKGGKATAVTFGVFLVVPRKEIVIIFFIVMLIGFFILDGDGWRIVISTAFSLVIGALMGIGVWPVIFTACVLAVIAVKNIDALKKLPRTKEKIYIGFGNK